MKKYIKLLPLIIYPYAYLIWLILQFVTSDTVKKLIGIEGDIILFKAIFIIFNVYVLFSVIYNIIVTVKGKYTAYEAAKMNLTIKAWQIPAYIFHFLMGAVGLLMSVWGIGFLMVAVIVDVVTIALTGLNAIGCAVKLKKDGIIPLRTAFLYGIGSFIFCIDIFVALGYVRRSRKHKKEMEKSYAQSA